MAEFGEGVRFVAFGRALEIMRSSNYPIDTLKLFNTGIIETASGQIFSALSQQDLQELPEGFLEMIHTDVYVAAMTRWLTESDEGIDDVLMTSIIDTIKKILNGLLP